MLARAQGHNFKFQRNQRLKIEEGTTCWQLDGKHVARVRNLCPYQHIDSNGLMDFWHCQICYCSVDSYSSPCA